MMRKISVTVTERPHRAPYRARNGHRFLSRRAYRMCSVPWVWLHKRKFMRLVAVKQDVQTILVSVECLYGTAASQYGYGV